VSFVTTVGQSSADSTSTYVTWVSDVSAVASVRIQQETLVITLQERDCTDTVWSGSALPDNYNYVNH
jgi:hypothetical protein